MVYRNTDNIAVCLLKNGYRFLNLLPKIIVNLLWLTCEHVFKLIQHNKPFSMSNIVVFLSFSAAGCRTFTVLLNRTSYTHALCSFYGCEFHIRMRTGAANLCAPTLRSFFGCELPIVTRDAFLATPNMARQANEESFDVLRVIYWTVDLYNYANVIGYIFLTQSK